MHRAVDNAVREERVTKTILLPPRPKEPWRKPTRWEPLYVHLSLPPEPEGD